jgi:hypothetical protein
MRVEMEPVEESGTIDNNFPVRKHLGFFKFVLRFAGNPLASVRRTVVHSIQNAKARV